LRRLCVALVCVIAAVPTVRAKPFVFYRGVLNAASFVPAGLPNGSIARGSIFSLFGRDLGPESGVSVKAFPLATTLESVSIEVCQQDRCVAAIPLFVRQDQVNAVMPSDAPLGRVSVRVTYDGEIGNFSPANVVESSFGAFTINSSGFGPGVVQNVESTGLLVNSADVSARPGETVILYGTGLGAGLNPDNVAPQAGDLPVTVEIWVGGRPVTVKRYSGRSPCCTALDQITFDIPADAPLGCYVPVAVRAGGIVSNDATISISEDGAACADPGAPASAALRAGGRLGSAVVSRDRRHLASGGIANLDVAYAVFSEEAGGAWAFHSDYATVPPGACRVSARRGALYETSAVYGGSPSVRALDAGGRLILSTAAGQRNLPPRAGPHPGYLGYLGSLEQNSNAGLLDAEGAARLRGAGGTDIGAFEIELQIPPEPDWSLQQASIERSQPLTLTWSGAAEGDQIWVAGGSADPANDAAVVFSCLVPPGQASFSVGPEVLGRLPDSKTSASGTAGFLAVSSVRATDASFPGADVGAGAGVATTSVDVEYR